MSWPLLALIHWPIGVLLGNFIRITVLSDYIDVVIGSPAESICLICEGQLLRGRDANRLPICRATNLLVVLALLVPIVQRNF